MITGNSIATVSDSVSRNGMKRTIYATLIAVGAYGGYRGVKYYFKNKEERSKHLNVITRDNRKSENRIKEMDHKQELKKELIDYRAEKKKKSSDFESSENLDSSSEDDSVASCEEIVSGEDIVADDLRLGLRCFHIGEDCGLIGRTQIGKTTWVLQYSIFLARGYQEEDAKLSPEWKLTQPMTVLYFAFEQDRAYFKSKYGKFLKDVPNLFIEVNTNASDFKAIRKKIMRMQNAIGNRRLLVVFDNITKMNYPGKGNVKSFFDWLESYRNECASRGVPITYLKVYHAQGRYKDYMPLDATTNYGIKTDSFFSQSLVGFGMSKDEDRKNRYLKELKNKMEQDGTKQTVSVYKFAGKDIPLFDYVGESEERDVLPSRVYGHTPTDGKSAESCQTSRKCGRPEKYTHEELKSVYEERMAGSTWREIFERRGWQLSTDKTTAKNQKKVIKTALKRHGFDLKR